MKIASVFGARPQFVKVALVSRQLVQDDVRHVVINTGQHYDELMADVFLREFGMPMPDYDLGVGSASHAVQTALIMERLEEVLLKEKPDSVVVYGDTNSTVGGALAASKLAIPVVHVEAGLRSFNRRMPEELNRIVADHLSDLLLVPGQHAAKQLMSEGISPSRIQVTGDIMYDAVLAHLNLADQSTVLERLGLAPQSFVLCTVHRAENTDDPSRLEFILESLAKVARQLPVVFPVHPRCRKAIEASGARLSLPQNLRLIDPVGYLDMLALEKNAAVVATDSGGVQREAFYLRVPCVVLRNETEWVELIASGANTLAPPDGSADIAACILSSVGKDVSREQPYGDGCAARKIGCAIRELTNITQDSVETVAV